MCCWWMYSSSKSHTYNMRTQSLKRLNRKLMEPSEQRTFPKALKTIIWYQDVKWKSYAVACLEPFKHQDETFYGNSHWILVVNYFSKTFYLRCLTGFWIRLCYVPWTWVVCQPGKVIIIIGNWPLRRTT